MDFYDKQRNKLRSGDIVVHDSRRKYIFLIENDIPFLESVESIKQPIRLDCIAIQGVLSSLVLVPRQFIAVSCLGILVVKYDGLVSYSLVISKPKKNSS